ncbi:tRNA pseudouridine synthase-like 1 [Fopius arisanus]|uniref:tRNA pseudouridine synthase n=1 Tax=Fopius arisanus TaxID=64838 RepID=A0A9R1TS51_9HYME|nr:PREDICTED: tRNA pseudouridine synthase-like 1 [Fopius arisanus]
MVRYLIYLSYIGTRYRGAAKQIGCERLMDIDTIQGALETCLYANIQPRSIKKPVVYTSSRTDAGVHALNSTAHVDLEHPEGTIYDTERIIRKSNLYFARCGHEIRLTKILPVTDEFNARRSARSREYLYRFGIAKRDNENRIPIAELGRSWHVRGENIDIDALRRAIPLFLGRKNFESFAAKNRTNREISYVRTLTTLNLEEIPSLMPQDPLSENFTFWQINVAAQSFLYNQVRRIVGALIGVASGTITERDIKFMLQVPNNQHWISALQMAPPQGLYLKSVNYDEEEMQTKFIIPHVPNTEVPKRKIYSILS